jgi:uncharacterized protein YcgL (UPF0745 family)
MDKLLDWIRDHDLLSINRLEERAGVPQRVLQKALKGERPLPAHHAKKLEKELKKYGYK